MNKTSTALFMLLFVLVGCGPSINAASKASVDGQLAALKPGSQAIEAPASEELIPISAGQWIKQHVVDTEGNHSFMTTKILSVDGDKVWVETETESYSGTTASKMLVSLGNRRDPETIEIYDQWTKHTDGRVEQLPSFLLTALKPTIRGALASLVIQHAPQGRERVTVPAAQFVEAYKARVNTKVMGMSLTADVWWHPEVPINGSVKTMGVDPKGSTELIAYGATGAQSVFP